MPAGTSQGIREQLNGIERGLARIEANQANAETQRKEMVSDIRKLSDDMGDALALGPEVHDLKETVAANTKALATIEAWRQRKIGASGLMHAIGAALGAVIGAGLTIIFGTHR